MPGEPAIRKVLLALRDVLTGNVGVSVTVYIDRPFDQPFRDEELPAVNIRCQQVPRSLHQYNAWRHDAEIMFDIVTRSATTQTVDAAQADIEADIAAILLNPPASIEPGSVFDMLTDTIPLGIGQRGNEFDMADGGESTSAWRCPFLTPIGDFRTIAGRVSTIT